MRAVRKLRTVGWLIAITMTGIMGWFPIPAYCQHGNGSAKLPEFVTKTVEKSFFCQTTLDECKEKLRKEILDKAKQSQTTSMMEQAIGMMKDYLNSLCPDLNDGELEKLSKDISLVSPEDTYSPVQLKGNTLTRELTRTCRIQLGKNLSGFMETGCVTFNVRDKVRIKDDVNEFCQNGDVPKGEIGRIEKIYYVDPEDRKTGSNQKILYLKISIRGDSWIVCPQEIEKVH